MRWLIILVLPTLFTGCAAKKKTLAHPPTASLVISKECADKVEFPAKCKVINDHQSDCPHAIVTYHCVAVKKAPESKS